MRFGIAHDLVDAQEIAARFPQFTGLVGDETGYYEPGGGYLRPERCIAAALGQARRLGAKTLVNAQVVSIERAGADVRIRMGHETVCAQSAIVATGAWLPDLAAPKVAARIAVHRQVLHWFPVVDDTTYRHDRTPTFIWTHGLDSTTQFYGFPPIDGLVKVAREDFSGRYDVETASREGDMEEGRAMAEAHVRGRLAGLAPLPSRSRVCPYAATADSDFVIDVSEGSIWISACSGHGFKHAAAIGEVAAALAAGAPSPFDLAPFALARFNI
jgi:sarcosine oxidase